MLYIGVMIDYFKRKLTTWLQLDRDRQHIQHLKTEISILHQEVKSLTNQLEKNMAALDNLTQAVADLQTAVDATVTTLNTPHPTDAQVQSAADAVQSQVARLKAALEPAPAAPVASTASVAPAA